MSVLKNLTKVVKGKLDKLIHKQNGSHDFLFYFIHYNIIIVQVIFTTIDTKAVPCIVYNRIPFPHEYSGEGRHMITHVEKEARYIQYGPLLFFSIVVNLTRIVCLLAK